jgi:diacylglycerol kinase family enzyme
VNSWTITAGVRLQGLALARPMARTASRAAVPRAIRVSATPLASWYDFPSAVLTAANAVATHIPAASVASAAAATLSSQGRGRAGWAAGAGCGCEAGSGCRGFPAAAAGGFPAAAAGGFPAAAAGGFPAARGCGLAAERERWLAAERERWLAGLTALEGRVAMSTSLKPVRGLLIVNPHATTTTENVTELVARSLAGLVDLDIEHTRYRGHARELAAAARADLVLVLGGDGAVNEAVNGIMNGNGSRPLLAVIPGGGGNVFARGLGMPSDTAAAVRRVREVIAAGGHRTIGLGLAGDRYFTFSAGLGMDAEVVREVDRQRDRGRRETTSLYLRTIVRWYYRGADRRTPALALERDGHPPAAGLFLSIVTNRSPFTYFQGRAMLPVPGPDFNSGLDLLALRRIRLRTIVGTAGQMLWVRSRPPRGRYLVSVRGAESLILRSARPIAFQVDGEYLGQVEAVTFQFVPHALRVIA